MQPPFLKGPRIALRALTADDATEDYLGWLNDPDVLRFRGPKAYPTTMAGLRDFLERTTSDLVLAVCVEDRHIGNIALNTIQWVHGTGEISIMIGAKDTWGKGYGGEAISLVTAHAFDSMGLRRLWSESPNPAFNAVMERIGWTREGVKRQALLVDGEHVDIVCWGLLASEYRAALTA